MTSNKNNCDLCLGEFKQLAPGSKFFPVFADLVPELVKNIEHDMKLCLDCHEVAQVAESMKKSVCENAQEIQKNTCCICMSREISEHSMFSDERVPSSELIKIVLDLNPNADETLMLCNSCWKGVNKIYLFKKKCLATEKILQCYRQSKKVVNLQTQDLKTISCNNFSEEEVVHFKEEIEIKQELVDDCHVDFITDHDLGEFSSNKHETSVKHEELEIELNNPIVSNLEILENDIKLEIKHENLRKDENIEYLVNIHTEEESIDDQEIKTLRYEKCPSPNGKQRQRSSSTDTADECIEEDLSPPKKRAKRHFDVKTKEKILNIYDLEMQVNPFMSIKDIVKRVAAKIGVCDRSIFKVMQEYKAKHAFSEPKTNQNRKKTVDVLDDFAKNGIRMKVHQYFSRNELPTLDKVLRDVNNDPKLPNFKRSTFHTLLKSINFKYEKRGKHRVLVDMDDPNPKVGQIN